LQSANAEEKSYAFIRSVLNFAHRAVSRAPHVRLGVSGADLPNMVGLYWSYDGSWNPAQVIRQKSSHKSCNAIICEVARRSGSIAVYGETPASKLRIWQADRPDDPANWQQLADVLDSQVKMLR
jgi:hypothetical protein